MNLIESKKHKYACLLRDGCDSQIRAGPKITAYNKIKGRHIITAKYSAGCSMTESMNDGGHGHDGLHRLFESRDFKMRPYPDPASPLYTALKVFLERYITPASMKTYWAFVCAFEPYIKHAITPVIVKSAAKKSGFEADKINVRTIMSYNPQFIKLTHEKAEEVIDLIKTVLVPYFAANQWIPESMYPDLFPVESGYDFTLSTRSGTPLNDLVTNRQRFMVDSSEQWQAVLADRKISAIAAKEKAENERLTREMINLSKPQKFRSCENITCNSKIDITTPALKKVNEMTWKKCSGKSCFIWACPVHFAEVLIHQNSCSKCNIA